MARKRLPRGLFEFISRGAEDEATLRENLASIKRVALRQRVGVDVSHRDLSIELFGSRQSLPIVVGVTGLSGMVAFRGEVEMARAALGADVPYTVGSSNFTALCDLPAERRDRLWCQVYPTRRRDVFDYQVSNAAESGAQVLVITMDSAVAPNREYMRRNGFSVPLKLSIRTIIDASLHPRWLIGTYLRYRRFGMPRFANLPPGHGQLFKRDGDTSGLTFGDDFTWNDVRALRDRWRGSLVLKGISTAEDACIAADIGVDGLIVSNHGGRSLDGCVASMTALPGVVDAVGQRLVVMVDGGFLRGADIVKALAVGARAVMVGRGALYGLASAGRAGAARALAIYRDEISRAMGLVGSPTVGGLTREHVCLPRGESR
jgi:(S)-mandelate dehydrogenase